MSGWTITSTEPPGSSVRSLIDRDESAPIDRVETNGQSTMQAGENINTQEMVLEKNGPAVTCHMSPVSSFIDCHQATDRPADYTAPERRLDMDHVSFTALQIGVRACATVLAATSR